MTDFNLERGGAVIMSDVDIVLQQIDLLFDTNPREVLGDENYGSTYDEYLYQLKISADNLKSQVLSDLRSLDLREFIPSVEVLLLQGTEQDIALINIDLTRYNENYKKSYKIG